MIQSLSRIMQFFKLVLVVFVIALVVKMGASLAHRPHDVVTQIEVSPNCPEKVPGKVAKPKLGNSFATLP